MEKKSSQLTLLLLLGFLMFSTIQKAQACDAFPSISPSGMAQNADIIVRATALQFIENRGVKFKVTEVLKGNNVPTTIIIKGSLNKRDDFNRRAVPYWHVRSSGDGDCYAYEYKEGAEFLLLLKKQKGELTPYWYPLAATNEQLSSKDEEWVKWVKEHLKWFEDASEIEKLKLSFEMMKKSTGWNIKEEILWRYRFIDSDQDKLQRLAKHLESLGYKYVKISKSVNEDDLEEFELQIEKLEKHSPATIFQRNQEFRNLATSFGIRKYYEWLTSIF